MFVVHWFALHSKVPLLERCLLCMRQQRRTFVKELPHSVPGDAFTIIVVCHVLTPHAQCTTVYPHSCAKCRLPRFIIDGIAVHGKEYGASCPSQRLADEVKMLLLTGKAAGSHFGPGSYQDRVKWAMQGMLL